MTGYVLGDDAEIDPDGIWEYIAADNVGAAVGLRTHTRVSIRLHNPR